MQPKNMEFLPLISHTRQYHDFHPRTGRTDLSSLFDVLSLANLAFYARRIRAAVRSFRGHIGILLSTTRGVRLGPAFQPQSQGHSPNERTYARAEGIKNLQATHPWVDNVDLQLFLMGFDAGEEHCTASLAKHHNNPDSQQSRTS
jgi:hypothetical protein